MPSLFAITVATNTLLLGPDRKGETSFTVSNISGRSVRGRARIVPDQPAAAAWLSIDGASEHDYAIAETAQITVKVVVPPTVPGGRYSFRLDMAGTDNPEEDYTQGPSVTFQVPDIVIHPLPPWVIPLIAAVAIVVVAVIVFLVVRGNSQSSANATATAVAATQTAATQLTRIAETSVAGTATARAGTAIAVAGTQTAIAVTAQAPARYIGNWVADNPDPRGVTTMSITPNGPNLFVQVQAQCLLPPFGTPIQCTGVGAAPYTGDPFRVTLNLVQTGQALQLTMLPVSGKLRVDVAGPNFNGIIFFHQG